MSLAHHAAAIVRATTQRRIPIAATLRTHRPFYRQALQLPARTYASTATAKLDVDPIPVTLASKKTIPIEGSTTLLPVLQELSILLEDEIGGDGSWAKRVKRSMEDLAVKRRGRIAGEPRIFFYSLMMADTWNQVIGDTAAAPRDVVSALLQDPLADSATIGQALVSRHQDANIDVFEIRYVDFV